METASPANSVPHAPVAWAVAASPVVVVVVVVVAAGDGVQQVERGRSARSTMLALHTLAPSPSLAETSAWGSSPYLPSVPQTEHVLKLT
eukprot:5090362-Amphidinium_carterae.1